ncbi:site-specific integrase [Oculatella sp. LEGE 06141]|uniref:site-specific integrase n=1 Tax=Oculatella sp. LEGE 06141 TaxID=1828648 RepID=UPI0018819FD7|nr:site-specific integrase [Oculatella sp. LEGE 06141]MBE9182894.1 site-specific integrase [Oculatella sp. LEGE 06141]
MDIDARIAQANGRLKAGKVGVSIERLGGRLRLRATLPPKPGSTQKRDFQQRISLDLRANPAGIKQAEAEAKTLGGLIAQRAFNWQPYLKSVATAPQTIADWVRRFEADYFQRGGTETTWRGDYWKVFKQIPADELLTADLVRAAVERTPANTKTRKRACMALGMLAKFANLECELSTLSGNYSPRRVVPRDLPDDRTIAECFYQLKNPAWRWVFGMMATYGLRNHEVFKLDLEPLRDGCKVLQVLEATKTGSRRVWACYPEWFEEFELRSVRLPNIDLNRSNEKIGNSVTDYFRKTAKLPFPPYSLRHCWAVRTLEFGLADTLAAQQMGHSVQVHNDTYHHWINEDTHQRAFDTLMMRGDRPRPPQVN